MESSDDDWDNRPPTYYGFILLFPIACVFQMYESIKKLISKGKGETEV